MAKNTDKTEFERIQSIKRAQAERGLFDFAPEYKALCLSKQGWEPGAALAALAPYAQEYPVARDECDIAVKSRPYRESQLKSVEPETAGGDGGPSIVAQIAPWATKQPISATTLRCAVDALVTRGWTLTPPAEQKQDAEDRCLVSWMETALKRAE